MMTRNGGIEECDEKEKKEEKQIHRRPLGDAIIRRAQYVAFIIPTQLARGSLLFQGQHYRRELPSTLAMGENRYKVPRFV